MLTRGMTAAVLIVGGCTERDEGGALYSVEELSFRKTPKGIDINKHIVCKLREPRRSPAIFAENNGFLVIGGCQRKGVHTGSAERIRWNQNLLESGDLLHENVIEAKSCSAFTKLDDSTGVLIGGFNRMDCLKSVKLVKLNEPEVSSTSLPDLPFRLKNSAGVNISNSETLLFGGWDESQTMKTVFRVCFTNCNTAYNIKMESILPYAVEGHCCAKHKDYIYVVGGYDGISVVDTIVRYSISDKTSEVLPTRLSTARENHVCEIILDRYLVVMAGWDGRQALDSVEVFEIINESPWILPTGIQFSLCEARIRPVSIPL
ncbi:hypothetical protein V3C99_005300 [Haemonchus contortus]|uniref:Kelch repeat protein n=1 Tax=Haemonchus contortus TaxID=6289 RepID=A0A7I4XWR0_HAECO